MAPLTAQVIVLLSQLSATSNMQTDDFDNPPSDDWSKMEVLGRMLIYIPFSLRLVTEDNKNKTRQAECKCTVHTTFRQFIGTSSKSAYKRHH